MSIWTKFVYDKSRPFIKAVENDPFKYHCDFCHKQIKGYKISLNCFLFVYHCVKLLKFSLKQVLNSTFLPRIALKNFLPLCGDNHPTPSAASRRQPTPTHAATRRVTGERRFAAKTRNMLWICSSLSRVMLRRLKSSGHPGTGKQFKLFLQWERSCWNVNHHLFI